MLLVLLSTSVKKFSVSCMRDFLLDIALSCPQDKLSENLYCLDLCSTDYPTLEFYQELTVLFNSAYFIVYL